MKLEKTIDEKKGILRVEATFRPRIYMSQKLDILTTERLIDIIKEEYDIEVKEGDILQQPVGHRGSKARRVRNPRLQDAPVRHAPDPRHARSLACRGPGRGERCEARCERVQPGA